MKEIGIFSRTYEIGDLEETYRRMTANGITHTQFNLSNAGLPSLPEHDAETKLERSVHLLQNITSVWMHFPVPLI